MTGIAGEQEGQRSHARRNHELLVAAAREVFAERGVEASLEEIARRAGVGIGTLYRHFATRDALVEAVFERRIGEFVAIAERAAAEPDAWLAFVGFLEGTLEIQAGDRLLKDVFLRSPPGAGRVEQRARGAAPVIRGRARARARGRAAARRLRVPRPRAAVLVVRAADRRHRRGRAERLAAPPALAARRAARLRGDAAGPGAALRRAVPAGRRSPHAAGGWAAVPRPPDVSRPRRARAA